jgi:taurine dioxygenase
MPQGGTDVLAIRKLTSNIGAEISGVDLSQPLSDLTVAETRQALLDYGVIFFRNQKVLPDDDHIRLGRYFGTLDLSEIQPSPVARREVMVLDQISPKRGGADNFHRDRTFLETPPLGSILQQVKRPEAGGDTCWASTYAAYDALSAPMQTFLDTLYARHSIEPMAKRSQSVRQILGEKIDTWPSAIHPVVEVHPETGRKALNVNANWTAEIVNVTPEESGVLLGYLFNHIKSPDFQVRFSWNEGDVAFWDNRCCQHFAVADYTTRRVMKRVAISGAKPIGVFGGDQSYAA